MADTIIRKFAALPSPRDSRDYTLASIAVAKSPPMPGTVGPLPPPFDQGQTPTCVGQGVTLAASILYYRKLGRWLFDESSALDLYRLAKLIDGSPSTEGTYPRAALKQAQKVGILGTDGKRYPIATYHSLLPSANPQADIEQAIGVLSLPVILALAWPELWMGVGSDPLPDPAPDAPSAGGHCVVTSRYARKHPAPHVSTYRVDDMLDNSWGKEFATDGHAYAGVDVLLRRVFDVWVLTV